MLGSKTKAYGDIVDNLQGLLHGLVVVIDPSIGSSSSMPGWAIYREQSLVDSGIFQINPTHSKPDRLRALHNHLRKLYIQYPPDVLVYEDIAPTRYGGGNAEAHASLLKAVGAILCVPGPQGYVGIQPVSWKPMVRPEYRKGDAEDAREIGWIVIQEAVRIEREELARKARRSKPKCV